MTVDEFHSALEAAIRADNRWTIRELSQQTSCRKRREACRHADNLILAEKTGRDDIAEYSRAQLAAVLAKIT